MRKKSFLIFAVVFLFILCRGAAFAFHQTEEKKAAQRYKLGILANRGKQECLRQWTATADYLSQRIPGAFFEIVPLDFHEIIPAVEADEVDFLILNSSLYAEMGLRLGLQRIATISRAKASGERSSLYGGVVFIRSDRKDIKTLNDLKSKTLIAVDELSLGGWLAVYQDMRTRRLDPFRFFARVAFGHGEDDVVKAVYERDYDAGIIRTGILESLQEEGKIDLNDFAFLIGKKFIDHKTLHLAYQKESVRGHEIPASTAVYPDWPFAKARHIDDEISNKVAIALLRIEPDQFAAIKGNYAGWVTPLNYTPVYDLLQDLGIGSYANYGKITLKKFVRQYWLWFIFVFVLVSGIVIVTVRFFFLNRKLVKNERKYRGLFENMDSGVAVYKAVNDGQDFVFKEFNKAAEIISGDRAENLIDKNVKEVFPGVETMGLLNIFRRVHQSGRSETLISKYEDDRGAFWAKNSVYKLSSSEVVAIYDDITAQIQAKEKIKAQNEFLQSVINSFHYPLYVIDVNTKEVVLFNKAANINPSEKKLLCHELNHKSSMPCSKEGELCPVEIVQKTKSDVTVEHVHCARDGSIKIFEITGCPIFDPDGEVTQLIEYCIDVTARRQMESQLKGQKDLFANLIACIPYDVFWKDTEGRYLGCNISYAKKAGLETPERIIGKTDAELPWTPEEVDFARETDQKVILKKKALIDFEETKHQYNGQQAMLLSSKVPLVNNKNDVIGVLGISSDISDRKKEDELKKHLFNDLAKVNQELRDTQEQLLHSEKMSAIGQLSAGVAHEIKNPLAIIALSIESFEMCLPDIKPELQERLKMIKDAVQRANKVVGDLLSFSRQSEMQIVPFDITDIIAKALDFAKKKSIMKNIQYETILLNHEALIIDGDPVLITQVILNILSNAIDAIEDEGKVILRTDLVNGPEKEPKEIKLTISDTGCGMPPHILKRIMEPFYTTKDQGDGTGLGLSLVYKIVERHQGTIDIQSQEGKGTDVIVKLPLKGVKEEEGEDAG